MAQNITLMGASYSAVPAVELPKTGGGVATFVDVTDTTATASDVAQGMLFHSADGMLAVGTGSGGSASPIPIVIRPDAELVHRWQADELLVEDLGLAIPAYKTSAQTIHTGAALSPTIAVDYTNYRYYVVMLGLSIPQYNTTTKVKGRCDYIATVYLYELAVLPASTIETIDGAKTYTSRNVAVNANGSAGREVYWTSATAISVANNATYGAYVTGQSPTISSSTLTVKAPIYGIRGSTTYMTSGAWSSMTDIREQYIIEVWRAPADACDGWGLGTGLLDIMEDVRNGGTLSR